MMDEFTNVVLTKVFETAATPADPEITDFVGTGNYPKVKFNIPTVDVDGNTLVNEKLSYLFYFEKDGTVQELTLTTDLYEELEEDMTEIPYGFTDGWDIYTQTLYLNQGAEELQSWTKIGLQSIYRGLDEEHRSNIVWKDLTEYWYEVGVNDIHAEVAGQKVWYNLNGMRVAQPTQKGLYICNGKKVVIK